jgi:hypothetical protein
MSVLTVPKVNAVQIKSAQLVSSARARLPAKRLTSHRLLAHASKGSTSAQTGQTVSAQQIKHAHIASSRKAHSQSVRRAELDLHLHAPAARGITFAQMVLLVSVLQISSASTINSARILLLSAIR